FTSMRRIFGWMRRRRMSGESLACQINIINRAFPALASWIGGSLSELFGLLDMKARFASKWRTTPLAKRSKAANRPSRSRATFSDPFFHRYEIHLFRIGEDD